MSDTIRFLGRTLERRGRDMWCTPGDEWPGVTIGKSIDGTWFAFVHLSGRSIGAQFKPSQRAARAAVVKQLRRLADELKGVRF